MSLSMHQVAIPGLIRTMTNLTAILDKAEAHCAAKKIEPSALLAARLYPDMFPLLRQVQVVTNHATGLAARLSGMDPPAFPDTEASFADLKARLAKAIDFLKARQADQVDAGETRDLSLTVTGKPMTFKGRDFMLNVAIPNFYFHVTTAYDILRHSGLEIGKRDYLGTH